VKTTERSFTGSGLRTVRPAQHVPFERAELDLAQPKGGIQQYAGTGMTRGCMGCGQHRKLDGSNGHKDALRWRCWSCVAERAERKARVAG
jgi:hypothetical protein